MAVALQTQRPVANGPRTDHPIPDLPFVDDSHIPVDDPVAIEAVGRNRGQGMWGREDDCRYGDDDDGDGSRSRRTRSGMTWPGASARTRCMAGQ